MYGPWEAGLGGVLDFAQLQNLHVLCLQETRVNNHSWNAVTRAVKARGWQLFPGPQGRNSKNVVEGGTLVLTKWPAEALAPSCRHGVCGKIHGRQTL